jgi:palmitoyltransferase
MERLERFCCQLTIIFPKVLVTSLYLYALYVFILIILNSQGLIYLFLTGLEIILFFYGLYTYFQVVRKGPGSPLDFEELCHDEESSPPPQFIIQRSVQVKSNGKLRYCNKCHCYKPDRTHHCSSCNRCQLKMDHHCPWFAECVGFDNYKHFIQFLIASILYSGLNLLVSGIEIYEFFHHEKFKDTFVSLNVIMLGVLALTMFLSVSIFTGITIYFLLQNLTTIEHYDHQRYRSNMDLINDSYYHLSQPSSKDYGNAFDLGWKENWRQVMGASIYEWIMPWENQYKRMDFYDDRGLYFDVNKDVKGKMSRNTRAQRELLEQLRQLDR